MIKGFVVEKIEDYWFVAYQSKYDESDERTVLGAHKDKEEALKMAVLHCAEIAEDHYETMAKVAECLDADFNIEGIGQYVDLNCPTEEAKIGAIVWYEEGGHWCIHYK